MANTGPNSNLSQFFFTLDKTEELNKRNTIFGKVVGDTLYNLVGMGELETDDSERPLNPPQITRIEVLSNPFDDMIIQRNYPLEEEQERLKLMEKSAVPVLKEKKPKKYSFSILTG
jgi:peptidyl-prolyl cis-trans isomerase SDCCAG10